MRKFLMLITLCLAVTLAGCGSKADDTKNNDQQQDNDIVEVTEEEIVSEDLVVAKINGTEIVGDEYNSIYVQTKVRLHQYRQDVSDLNLLKEQTLNTLIDQELLRQDANKVGITVTEEEVQEQFDEVKGEVSEEHYTEFLKQYQLTEDEFKEELYFAILHEKYLESEIPAIEVTNEEIQEVYDQLKENSENNKDNENNEEFPDYEDIADQLKLEITMQKEQEELQAKINELREAAEIEKMI